MIEAIIFDWGSTLGLRGGRKNLMYNSNMNKKLEAIDSEAFNILKYLKKRKYKIGLLSNMEAPPEDMNKGLQAINMLKYFDAETYNTEDNMCSKPCPRIFHVMSARLGVPLDRCLYVGNNYVSDVLGSTNVGMHACYFTKYVKDVIPTNHFTISNLMELSEFF